jgi:hypothetical protein
MATENPIITGVWQWSSQAGTPPTNKQVRTDTGNWATAAQLYFSDVDDSGVNRAQDLDSVQPGDLVRLEHNTDTTRYAVFNVVGALEAVAAGSYHTINVTLHDSGGVLPNSGTQLQTIFVNVGDPIPEPTPGHMWIRLTLTPYVTEEMITDLMRNMSVNLQMVTHLVNYAEYRANVNGTLLTYEDAILPAYVSDPVVEPLLLP